MRHSCGRKKLSSGQRMEEAGTWDTLVVERNYQVAREWRRQIHEYFLLLHMNIFISWNTTFATFTHNKIY